MKHFLNLLVCLMISATSAPCASIGDTYSQVVAEKGSPKSQMEAGALRVLTYPDAVIKLKDNVVVSVRSAAPEPKRAPPPSPTPTKPPSPQAQILSLTAQLDDAAKQVRNIINQEVPAQPIDRSLSPPMFAFHDGATRPDFNSVDVRATQETHYDSYPFITWKGHADLMWVGKDLEFNPMTKYFYADRTVPKKKLTEEEMLEVNRLYRVIGKCEQQLGQLGYSGEVP